MVSERHDMRTMDYWLNVTPEQHQRNLDGLAKSTPRNEAPLESDNKRSDHQRFKTSQERIQAAWNSESKRINNMPLPGADEGEE